MNKKERVPEYDAELARVAAREVYRQRLMDNNGGNEVAMSEEDIRKHSVAYEATVKATLKVLGRMDMLKEYAPAIRKR